MLARRAEFVTSRYGRLRDEEGCAQIDLLVDVPGLLVHAQRGRQPVNAGGLDHDVGGAAEQPQRVRHRAPGRRRFAQIGLDAAQRRRFASYVERAVDGGDLGAFVEQPRDDGRADAAGRAGNDRQAAREACHRALSLALGRIF